MADSMEAITAAAAQAEQEQQQQQHQSNIASIEGGNKFQHAISVWRSMRSP
jgi:hypothetical protein